MNSQTRCDTKSFSQTLEHSRSRKDLAAIFAHRSVVVIGASRDPGKVGHAIFGNILTDFQGIIYPVNPKAHAIQGVRSPCE